MAVYKSSLSCITRVGKKITKPEKVGRNSTPPTLQLGKKSFGKKLY
jgi:hypothetical protein